MGASLPDYSREEKRSPCELLS